MIGYIIGKPTARGSLQEIVISGTSSESYDKAHDLLGKITMEPQTQLASGCSSMSGEIFVKNQSRWWF
jgi:hypothetical protein